MQLKVLETKIIKQNRADLCLQFNSMAYQLRFSTQRPNASNSLTPAVFHCQNVTDNCLCLPHFCYRMQRVKVQVEPTRLPCFKFENNTWGRARLRDSALKFLCPGLFMTSPDHLVVAEHNSWVCSWNTECRIQPFDRSHCFISRTFSIVMAESQGNFFGKKTKCKIAVK